MKTLLTLSDIQRIKELYIHTYEKHKLILNDMILFQDTILSSSSHYRDVRALDTPYGLNKDEYDINDNICGAWEYAFIIMNLPLEKGLTVLEAASSASILPAYLTNLGYNFISVDLETSYQEAIKKNINSDYQIIQADLKEIPVADNSVDVIISNSALEHIQDDIAMWKEFTRILKPSGKMIHTFPIAKPGYTNAWLQEPIDFFKNPTEIHNKTHRLIDKRIAEENYFLPNNLWVEIWEEHFYHREIQAFCVVKKNKQ
jgi:ubiquinone/menaquinone biosynthesis C-methylase UbiE